MVEPRKSTADRVVRARQHAPAVGPNGAFGPVLMPDCRVLHGSLHREI